VIPPLDTHAHIEPDIPPTELDALRACILAVTRTLADYESTRHRSDTGVVWGVGCHPGLVREVRDFSTMRFREAMATTPVIGEVGLDGSARTPIETQLHAFRSVLRLAAERPRILSIHSYKATDLVLGELREFRPEVAILHWWLGTPAQTEEAANLGAYFSVNASQARKWESLRLVPEEQLLLETDHPFGDRSEAQPHRPGNLLKAEGVVAAALDMTADDLRRQTWRTLRGAAERLSLVDMFPRDFQVQFLAL
jgi:TatD DNase family protein